MKNWIRIYKHNIYGIMGTLVFHIVLVGFFMLAGMDMKGEMKEEEILVEIPLEMIEAEESEEQENTMADAVPEDQALAANTPSNASNRASGRDLPRRDGFFDDQYQQEVASARQLVKDVNKQLSKEIADISSIPMPVDVTEGKDKEEISNIVYSGESNVEYHLGDRYHLRLPIPVYLARGGGVVTVDITVDREGKVVGATPRQSAQVADDQIYQYARAAAWKSIFNPDPLAPVNQQGTIKYTFVAQ